MLRKKKIFECFYMDDPCRTILEVKKASDLSAGSLSEIGKRSDVGKNIKTCIGFINMLRHGFILKSPISFRVTVDQDTNYNIEYPQGVRTVDADVHVNAQASPYYDGWLIVKIIMPVFIRESTGVQCVYTGCSVHNKKLTQDMYVPTGIVDFKSNNVTNMFVLMRVPKSGSVTYQIDAGDPVAQMIPMTESDWELTHTVDRFFTPINVYCNNFKTSTSDMIKRLMKW